MKASIIIFTVNFFLLSYSQEYIVYKQEFRGMLPTYFSNDYERNTSHFTSHVFDVETRGDSTYFSIGIHGSRVYHYKQLELVYDNDTLTFREKQFDTLSYRIDSAGDTIQNDGIFSISSTSCTCYSIFFIKTALPFPTNIYEQPYKNKIQIPVQSQPYKLFAPRYEIDKNGQHINQYDSLGLPFGYHNKIDSNAHIEAYYSGKRQTEIVTYFGEDSTIMVQKTQEFKKKYWKLVYVEYYPDGTLQYKMVSKEKGKWVNNRIAKYYNKMGQLIKKIKDLNFGKVLEIHTKHHPEGRNRIKK